MKKIFYIVAVVAGLAGIASCGDDNYIENKYYVLGNDTTSSEKKDTTVVTPENNPLDSAGTATKPTDWVSITDIDPTAFMVVSMDSTGTPVAINEGDMLAAFVGTECRGVATPYTEIDGATRYSMVINTCANSETDENDKSNNQVELRYYSESKHRIYISDKIDFAPGSRLGTIQTSYKPTWK